MPLTQQAFNGFFERLRTLLQLQGGGIVVPDVTPVVIVGDSREPMGSGPAYRRFGCSIVIPSQVGPGYIKFSPIADVVIDHWVCGFSATTAGGVQVRVLSAPEVVADTGVTFAPPSTAQGAYFDGPQAGPPPLYVGTGGLTTAMGRVAYTTQQPATAASLQPQGAPFFIPSGRGLYFLVNSGTTLTNWTVNVSGYART
jgi:hypothetical protein